MMTFTFFTFLHIFRPVEPGDSCGAQNAPLLCPGPTHVGMQWDSRNPNSSSAAARGWDGHILVRGKVVLFPPYHVQVFYFCI